MSALMQLSFSLAFLKAGFHYEALCTFGIETISTLDLEGVQKE